MTGAYSFICEQSSTDSLRDALNALEGWVWSPGDSYWYGDYVACKPFEGVRIRIVDYPRRVNDKYQYDADVRFRNKQHAAGCGGQSLSQSLAQISAHDVEEIEPFD